MNKLIGAALLIFTTLSCIAQDLQNPVTTEDLQMQAYSGDSTANAVVLQETGTARLKDDDNYNLVFKYNVRIKIFNSKAFDQGNVEIPVYKENKSLFEQVYDISAVTWFLDEAGNKQETALDRKKVYRENKNSYWDVVKFTLPNLKDGCVIEYSYTLESPFFFNLRKWEFQSSIPKISSQFTATIPAVYNYNVLLNGPLKLAGSSAEVRRDCFQVGGLKADCSVMTYAMKDIPAFTEEAYMTSSANFRSALRFELVDYTDYKGNKHRVTKDWKDVDLELSRNPMFGGQVRKDNLFDDHLKAIGATGPDTLANARKVFSFIRDRFTWNKIYSKYSEDGIRKAFERRSGNSADINLSLVAALKSAGLPAEPVLLSSRDNGLVSKLYPVISEFNYVIARVEIGGKAYLLDATDRMLPFGLLPLRCFNGSGRVISSSKPSYWTDIRAAHKEREVLLVDLVLEDSGRITGRMSRISYDYQAYNRRREMKKFSTLAEHRDDFAGKLAKTVIKDFQILGLDTLENPLTETYQVEIDAFDDLNRDQLFLNPFMISRISENPFKLKERSYPVDWGIPTDTKLVFSLKLPANLSVVDRPGNLSLGLPDQGGQFILGSEVSGDIIRMQQTIRFNKSVYPSDEYPYIKELFNRIIQTHRADIVIRKKA